MVARTKVPNAVSSTGTAISVRGYVSGPNQQTPLALASAHPLRQMGLALLPLAF